MNKSRVEHLMLLTLRKLKGPKQSKIFQFCPRGLDLEEQEVKMQKHSLHFKQGIYCKEAHSRLCQSLQKRERKAVESPTYCRVDAYRKC